MDTHISHERELNPEKNGFSPLAQEASIGANGCLKPVNPVPLELG
jgi:hypothetical protein